MRTAHVLMTAMPPTVGHLHLIEFANELADETQVIVCTQPGEPFAQERWSSLVLATRQMNRVRVTQLHMTLEQDPAAPGFWEMWDKIMLTRGFKAGDYVVSSEAYGQTLADRLNGTFMPYDPNRELYFTKGTKVREQPGKYFGDILPEFQKHMTMRVTFFGAESTGKTTTSHEISKIMNGHWLFEYARPYLELVGTEINVRSMTAIWKGQHAIQRHANSWTGKPFIIQDTDLFSTVGYWGQPHWTDDLGEIPYGLISDAVKEKSDLYIIMSSDIPFEHDAIRYGGDVRENNDKYWIELAEQYGLNYVVVNGSNWYERLAQAEKVIKETWQREYADKVFYDRKGL